MAGERITIDISILQGIFGDLAKLQQQLSGVAGGAMALDGSATSAFSDIRKSVNGVTGALGGVESGFDSTMRNVVGDLMQPLARTQELEAKLRDLGERVRTSRSVGEISKLKKEIAATQKELDGVNTSGMERKVGGAAQRMGGLFRSLVGPLAGVFAVGGVLGFGSGVVKAAGDVQIFQSSLNTLLGSKAKADALFAQTAEFANTTPFDLPQVQQATKQLLAYGFANDQVIPSMRMLGNVSSAVGADFGQVAYAFGTAKTQGTVYTRDLMQLTNVGIPIMDELAKVMGVNTTQVKDLAEKGQIGFAQLEQAMGNLGGPTGKWKDQLEGASKTITGRLSNLGGDFRSFVADMGLALAPQIESVIGALASGLDGLRSAFGWVMDNGQAIKDVIAGLAIASAAYGAVLLWNNRALIQSNALKGIAAVRDGVMAIWTGLTTTAVAGATTAQWSWNAALMDNPIGIVIGLVAGLVAGVLWAWNRFEGFRAFLYGFWEASKSVFKGVGEALQPLIDLVVGFGKTLAGALSFKPALIMEGIKQGTQAVMAAKESWGKPIVMEAALAYAKGDAEGRASFQADAAKKKEGANAYNMVPQAGQNVGAAGLVGGQPPAGAASPGAANGAIVTGASGSGKVITMNIEMKNSFVLPRDGNMGAREVADKVIGQLVAKLNDAQFAMG